MLRSWSSPPRRYGILRVSTSTIHWSQSGINLSGRAMALIGLRMMPTFPSPSLKFRTAGFPQYGFKASLSVRAFQSSPELKSPPDIRSVPRCCSLPFARSRAATAAWALSPTRSTRRRAAVQAAVAALPQGSLAPERVLLSPSITAYYDPIRQSIKLYLSVSHAFPAGPGRGHRKRGSMYGPRA